MFNIIKFIEYGILVFFIFFSFNYHAQNLSIYDSITNKKLSYCEIIIEGQSFYSDYLGGFKLNKISENPIMIKRKNYEDKKIIIKEKTNIAVALSPKPIKILEVEIKSKSIYTIKDNFKKRNTTILPLGLNFGFVINNPYNSVGLIKSISIPIKKIINSNSFLKLDFYEVKNEKIESESLNSEPIFISLNDLKKGKDWIDLSRYKIYFPEKAILVSLKLVKEIGVDQSEISMPTIQIYNSEIKDNELIYFKNFKTNNWMNYKNEVDIPKPSISFQVLL